MLSMPPVNQDPFPAFLGVWADLCARAPRSKGRRAILPRDVLESPTLDASLLALGYPEALASAKSLGSTLARLRARGDCGDGRRLERYHAARGTVWYVVDDG